jgi:chromosome segregation ATPase
MWSRFFCYRTNLWYQQTFNIASLLSFDPSCIEGSSSDSSPAMSPPTAALISSQLENIITQLEQPIETLVKDCQVIRSALEPIMDKLPVALKQVLQPTAYLEFFREEVLAAASRLSARENQDALKEQISKECTVANQLKARLDDNSSKEKLEKDLGELNQQKAALQTEIQRLQNELAKVDTDIITIKASIEENAADKHTLATELKSSLSQLRTLQKNLVTSSEEADKKAIATADGVRQKALSAAQQYLQQLPSSTPC